MGEKGMWLLIFTGAVVAFIFGTMYYQSGRDKKRWRRISAGVGIHQRDDGNPDFVLDGKRFTARHHRILVLWDDQTITGFADAQLARAEMAAAIKQGRENAARARIFAFNGERWSELDDAKAKA